jgi:glutathione synthase/RimK-type ligase-like ATP-grasp enzyme
VSVRNLWWIVADRGTVQRREVTERRLWSHYRVAAERCGLKFGLHDPGSVVVDAIGGKPRVFVDGEPVDPTDTIFVTALYTLPHQLVDAFRTMSTFTLLQHAGFYLPTTPELSLIATDKLTTALYLADCPIPPIPTFRFGTGRHDSVVGAATLAELPYPVIVKPAGWLGGMGVFKADNERQVREIASLAAASDCDLVCQEFLGDKTVDYRLYFVDGQVHTTMRRSPAPGEVAANLGRGGSAEFVDLPVELEKVVGYLAEKFPIPYFCADFLFDGTDFHLSEVELDGSYGPMRTGADTGVAEARFTAYAKHHERLILGRS